MRPLAFMLILGLGWMTACGSHPREKAAGETSAPIAVQVHTTASTEWPLLYEATGTVRARTAATLSSKVMGHVRQVNFQTGDRVREGQVLVELDSRDLDAQLQQAEAAHREAQDALQEVEAAIASAKANLELAQATFRRIQDLFEKKSVSNQEFDEAAARLKSAQAAYEMAAAKRRQVTARLSQAAAVVESAKVMRGYARLTAPFDGIITEKRVEPGDLAAPGAPLAVIERADGFRLEVSVEESRLRELRPGQTAEVSLEALDRTLEARIGEIVPSVDAVSRTGIVKLDLPNLPQVRSGMFGRARFPLGNRPVLAIPASAVREQGQLRSVFVVENGLARARLVTLGASRGDRREVLSGLAAGEKIVAPLPDGLVDGARVEVRP